MLAEYDPWVFDSKPLPFHLSIEDILHAMTLSTMVCHSIASRIHYTIVTNIVKVTERKASYPFTGRVYPSRFPCVWSVPLGPIVEQM